VTNYAWVGFLLVVLAAGFILNPVASAFFAMICYVWVDRRVTGLIVLGVISLAVAGGIYASLQVQPPVHWRVPIEPLFFGTPVFGVPFVLLTVPREDDDSGPDDRGVDDI